MKVEINKKHVVIIAIAFALVAISFISGYFIGTESAKNPKGDGEHFYSEILDDSGVNDKILKYHKILYHSTLECPNIRNGVEIDGYGYVESITNAPIPYFFCSTCMSEELIKECQNKIDVYNFSHN